MNIYTTAKRKPVFQCSAGNLISSSLVCSDRMDCSDGDDEQVCNCHIDSKKPLVPSFCQRTCKQPFCKCPPLFFQNPRGGCYSWLDAPKLKDKHRLTSIRIYNTESNFTCIGGKIISSTLINDLIPDCPNQDDEVLYIKLLNNPNNFLRCKHKSDLPCVPGHPHCFHYSKLCSYSLDKNGFLSPCRNGAHLEFCTDFECNSKYKCPGYYCVPWFYLCDGSWDCPAGDDEGSCINRTCVVQQTDYKKTYN